MPFLCTYAGLATYLNRANFRTSMADQLQQRVAVHCFSNLVEFLNIHKFETDWAKALLEYLPQRYCRYESKEVRFECSVQPR